MCGIVGVLDPSRRRSTEEAQHVVSTMADTMVPRGPDGSGAWADGSATIAFGHRRLAVLDVSPAGHQPMTSADGRFVITYNGEIYDHQELRDDLERAGATFRGHADTEYLVEAFSRWGVMPTLDRVDGMFALAVWDNDRRVLTLARDRMGEKPLFYGRLGSDEIVFGSSLDALRAHPHFDRGIDRDALTLFFRHKYVPAPFSIFEGIAKLPPGRSVEIDDRGQIGTPSAYWDFIDVVARGRTFAGSSIDAADRLQELLRASVSRRLVADVPVGAFLSGGIDSSTVVSIAQAVSTQPVRTFTIGNESADFDESDDAARIARHLGTDHTSLVVTASDALAVVDQLGAMYDEPFGDSSQIPTHLVSSLARQHVTVALSGDGGDELFGGYNRYVWAPAIWNRLHRVPTAPRRVAAMAGVRVPPAWWDAAASVVPASHRPRNLGNKVTKVLDVADAPSSSEVFHRIVSHWPDPAQLVRGGNEPTTVHTDPGSWPDGTFAEQMMAIDAVTYLPDDILAKVDRASMAVSLEARVPLLSRDIVEFAASLPLELLIRGGRSKAPLRDVLTRFVPDDLFQRPKAGFGVPLENWLRGPLAGWARERLASGPARSYLNQPTIDRTWDQLQRGRGAHAYRIWDVVMFVQWCEHRGIA